MGTSIAQSKDFSYLADVRPVSALPGKYSIEFRSQWGGAKDPTAERLLLQLTLDRQGLVALRDLIDAKVMP